MGTGTATYTSTASTLGTTTGTAVTTSTTRSTAVPTSTTSASFMPASSTSTSRRAQCSDHALPSSWSGGGVHTCMTYEKQSLAHCNHPELRIVCCFCGGGQSDSITTLPPPCVDAPLPVAWSGGGVHTCSTYEQHGGLTYCQHGELATACCFCCNDVQMPRFSAKVSPTNSHPSAGQISRASMSAPNVVIAAFLLICTICGPR